MISQTVNLKSSVDLVNGIISIDELTTEPGLFDQRDLFKSHVIRVLDTRDAMIREALIKLGWRPPLESAPAPYIDVRERVRAQDPGTSIAAAERITRTASRHAESILSALIDRDMTVREIATHIGITHVQVARRMPELQRAARVVVVQTPSGEDLERGGCRVWRRVA